LYETVGDRAKADGAYTKLLELNPEDEKSIQAAAGYYRRSGRPERAMELVTNYAQSRPTAEQRANAQYLVANEHLQRGDAEASERTLLSAAETAETVENARALAEFYLRVANRPEKAGEWYAKAVERARRMKSPLLPTLLEADIAWSLHRNINDIERARKDLEELRTGFPDYVRGLLWESEIRARTGDMDRAIASLTDYLAKRPNDPNALYQRARHQVARGRLGAAIDDLGVLRRTAPLALELQPRLLLARLQLRSGRKDLWLAELESLVKDAPESAMAIEELARAYLQEKRLADADRIVTAQINRAANSPDARWLLLRGRISLDLGDAEKALSDFRRGAEVSDFSPESVMNVMDAYLRLGRFPAGVEYFERYGGEQPAAKLVSRFAQLLARAGSKTKAVDQFRRAMGLAVAETSEAIRAVADDALAAFTADDAIALFGTAPQDATIGRANERILIRAFTAAKRYDEAASRLESMIPSAADPRERAGLQHELGDVHQIADHADQAVHAYQEALKDDPDNWITQNNIAYLLSDKRGENKAALPYAQRAVALADNAFTLDTLGWIYVGLQQYTLAVAELSRAVRLDPDYALPYYHLGEAYRRNGQFTEAADILKNGRDVANNANDAALVALIDVATEKSGRRDAAP
jgi:tetratricopeptide (TPR) repeat protein